MSRPMTAAGQSAGRPNSAARPMTASSRNVNQSIPGFFLEKFAEQSLIFTAQPSTAQRGGRRMNSASVAPKTANRTGSRMKSSHGHLIFNLKNSWIQKTSGNRVNVSERPVTQQGLQGVRPMTRGGTRQIMDKSYFMGYFQVARLKFQLVCFIGLLRTKISELSGEISRLNRDISHYSKETQNMNVYEKR